MNLALYSLEAGGIGCCLKGLFWPLGLAEVGCKVCCELDHQVLKSGFLALYVSFNFNLMVGEDLALFSIWM